MPKPMKQTCPNCEKEFRGRSDKRYCSLGCKNQHNNSVRRATLSGVLPIDQILHQNRSILAKLSGGQPGEATIHERGRLEQLGFRFEFVTGASVIADNRLCRFLYDFEIEDLPGSQICIKWAASQAGH